jgi:hypothetical protein
VEGRHNFEKNSKRILPSNEELLPRYYEVNGDHVRYSVLRSIPIDNHDVTWMACTGSNFTGNFLKCACDFAEGVSWQTDEKYGVVNLDGGEHCRAKKTAQIYRQLELQDEYIERFDDVVFGNVAKDIYTLRDYIPEIVMDLLERKTMGEFIGDKGAYYAGGHLFVESIVGITEIPYEELWPILEQMEEAGRIRLNHGVIHPWYEQRESNETD